MSEQKFTSPAAEVKLPLGLYLHIPFCKRKCLYCDFLSAPATDDVIAAYASALCSQIAGEAYAYREYRVKTVFFGGGTPSLLTAAQMQQIMEAVRQAFEIDAEAEISMECNPGTLTAEKLAGYKSAGINRLSIGLQSAENRELQALGRIHTWEAFLENYRAARAAGFTNINIDLMSALPGQTVEGWMETLRKAADLKPEHISAYSLIIEEGTPFFERYGENGDGSLQACGDACAPADSTLCRQDSAASFLSLPTEDDERLMYELTEKFLQERGYHRYEISNYAREGRECRHNASYWKRIEYLGLGTGAASLIDGRRFRMTDELQEYLHLCKTKEWNKIRREETVLSREEQMEEFMFLGLRMTEGVSLPVFEAQFGVNMQEIYGEVLKTLEKEQLLVFSEDGEKLKLTKRGVDVSNYVLAEFLLS